MIVRTHRPGPHGSPTSATAWVERVRERSGDPLVGAAASALVNDLLLGPTSADVPLRRFGRQVGRAGWSLADAADWIEDLGRVRGRVRRHVRRLDAGLALADGWIEGMGLMQQLDAVTDPLTGFATPTVLGLRLREVVAHASALGLEPASAYAIGVVDARLADTSPLVRDAARVLMADRTEAAFSTGETICSSGDRLLILAARTPTFTEALQRLAEELSASPLLATAGVITWLEQLPEPPDRLDAFVLDLCG